MNQTITRYLSNIYALILVSALLPAPSLAQSSFFRIGTGDVTGLYYTIGGVICRFVSDLSLEDGVPICLTQSTSGSSNNVERLQDERLQAAIVQSDIAYDAFTKLPATSLRVIAPLHEEVFTIVAGANTKIHTFDDLAGKTLNVGSLDSGNYLNMVRLLDSLKMTMSFFEKTTYLQPLDAMNALCNGDIDATVYMVGHPNRNTSQSLTRCGGNLVTLSPQHIKKITNKYPSYVAADITHSTYPGSRSVKTFGLTAILVTTIDAPDMLIYQLTKALVGDIDKLKSALPAFQNLTANSLARDMPNMIKHAGAKRFFSEQ